jgi:hypothetical protein
MLNETYLQYVWDKVSRWAPGITTNIDKFHPKVQKKLAELMRITCYLPPTTKKNGLELNRYYADMVKNSSEDELERFVTYMATSGWERRAPGTAVPLPEDLADVAEDATLDDILGDLEGKPKPPPPGKKPKKVKPPKRSYEGWGDW